MNSKRMKNLHPYVPGEQPNDRVYVKLNANENPYPPCPEVLSAVTGFVNGHPEKLGLYPDPDSLVLHEAIAGMLNRTGGVLCRAVPEGKQCRPAEQDRIPFTVTPDMIYSGNGSDEVLSFVFYAFFDSGRKLVVPEFSYSFYPVYGGFYNIPLDPVKLNADWTLDTEKMTARAKRNGSGIIFANPNAPTGRGLSRAQVRSMIRRTPKDKAFVVDEAYADFGGESCIPLLAEFPNLLIVRTFSKSLCSAGMRLGYIVASPELVQTVTTVKNSLNHFPIDAVAQTAGTAACSSDAYYAECAKKIVAERESFSGFLSSRGWDVVPSQTNFVFARKNGVRGEEAYRKIKEKGVLVRHFATRGIDEYLRITIGTAEQMQVLRSAVEDMD
jgi:Histidinol-phosphate/aromatic aminotransferase and cobyric acid decarboxylase